MHGGGWVLNDEKSSDVYLQKLANTCSLLCISIGYRLAPEFPFPAGAHDCYDVAEWLLDNGVAEYGAPLSFIGGESAGANLAIVTVLHLATSPIPRYANHRLLGFIGHYGAYSLQWTPSLKNFKREPALVLDENIMTSFRTAYVPEHRVGDLTSPEISPLYANLEGLSLPPAIFTCGTEDCLRDDSAFMSVKWMMAGAEAVVRFYPGSPHGFILFSGEVHENAALAFQDVTNFVMPKMSQGVRSTL
jgi:acetyl esterase/lipase